VHHPKYYQAEEDNVPPYGDWEDPVRTTFLAVMAGTEFAFAVLPRRAKHADHARQAAEWLKAALADRGAGAKTAAGYGRIVSEKMPQPITSSHRRCLDRTLELVTPAGVAMVSKGFPSDICAMCTSKTSVNAPSGIVVQDE
jgi:hypothetical protein